MTSGTASRGRSRSRREWSRLGVARAASPDVRYGPAAFAPSPPSRRRLRLTVAGQSPAPRHFAPSPPSRRRLRLAVAGQSPAPRGMPFAHSEFAALRHPGFACKQRQRCGTGNPSRKRHCLASLPNKSPSRQRGGCGRLGRPARDRKLGGLESAVPRLVPGASMCRTEPCSISRSLRSCSIPVTPASGRCRRPASRIPCPRPEACHGRGSPSRSCRSRGPRGSRSRHG